MQRKSSPTRSIALALAGFVLILAGLRAVGLDQVTVQLKWIHQAQFAGFYAAKAQGYYADEGIEVRFLPGGVGIDIFAGVETGDVDFSVVGAEALLQHVSEGASYKAIATTYRTNPVVFVAFTDSGIESPYDFPGKSVSMSPGYDMAVLEAMLQNVGIDIETLELVPYNYNDQEFIDGEIDVTISFAAGSLPALRASIGDRDLNVIWPNDYGVHFYSDTVIAGNQLLEDNPDLVLRFLRATLQGHLFAIAHPDEAIDATMPYAVVQDRAVQEQMLTASIPLIYTGEDHIGWMRASVWQGMHDILSRYGILTNPFDISEAFTMQFLEAIYDGE